MKKFLYFFIICFAFVGIIGSVGYTLYCHAWFIALCECVVAWLAVPKIQDYIQKLLDNE